VQSSQEGLFSFFNVAEEEGTHTNELAETSTRLGRANTRVEELKQAVISQDLSVEDVQKMQAEQKGVTLSPLELL
jgi:hypothetical protein